MVPESEDPLQPRRISALGTSTWKSKNSIYKSIYKNVKERREKSESKKSLPTHIERKFGPVFAIQSFSDPSEND